MTAATGLSGRVVFALMMREMTTRYSRLTGGYVWALLEPIAAIALLSFVFSQAFRAPPIGTSFALFYATGYLPFMIWSDLAAKTAEAVNFNRQLLTYPTVGMTDALVARFVLNLLTHLAVFAIVVPGILVAEDLRAALHLPSIVLGLCLAAALGFGMGALNCLITAFWPVWTQIWSVLTRPMFIVSCIFFTFESVPAAYRDILWYNPVAHPIGLVRSGFFPSYDAAYVSGGFVLLLALGTGVTGLFLLETFRSRILNT